MPKIERVVAVNETGRPIGEDHYRADLTDGEVELARRMREKDKMTYAQIAKIFEVSRGAIAKICLYQRRNQFPARHKKVVIEVAT
jgi:hypothetical protein